KTTVLKSTMMAVLVPVMLVVPTVLRAQNGGVAAQGQAQSQSQVQTPQARIDAALSAAAKADIPVELVKNKIAEGQAKRVPPERIASAVEARVTSLTRASETMKHAGVAADSAGELAV